MSFFRRREGLSAETSQTPGYTEPECLQGLRSYFEEMRIKSGIAPNEAGPEKMKNVIKRSYISFLDSGVE